jgi:hypothetical protein
VRTFAGLFTSLSKLPNMQEKNKFPEPNRHMLPFLYPILIVEGCILSTDGDDASDYNQESLSSTS